MIGLAFASFGRSAPRNLSGWRRAGLWLVCAVFVLWGLAGALVLNAVALLAGTTIRSVGRDGVRYRFFRLFGVRAILVATPVLFCFFAWQEARVLGLVGALWPMAAVLALAAAALGVCATAGRGSVRPRDATPPSE